MTARRTAAAAFIAAVALVLSSCSTTPPAIVQTFWQLNLVHNLRTGESHERLSFFVQVSNTDGLSDLGGIYLLNDKSETYWHLDPSNWVSSNRNGELWVGTNRLQMPNRSPIPRGSYRVLVNNLAGERATGSFVVSADRLDLSKVSFPTISRQGGRVSVEGRYADTSMWLYNLEGGFVGSRTKLAQGYPVGSLVAGAGKSRQLTVYAYEYDKTCGCGLVNGPYAIPGAG